MLRLKAALVIRAVARDAAPADDDGRNGGRGGRAAVGRLLQWTER